MKAIPKETDDKQTTAFSRGVLGDFYLEKANNDLRSPFYNLIHFLHLKKENPQLLDDQIKANIEKKTMKSAENLVSSMEDMLL